MWSLHASFPVLPTMKTGLTWMWLVAHFIQALEKDPAADQSHYCSSIFRISKTEMTRADFYILEDENLDAAYRFACRLCLKAISSGSKVHLHLNDEKSVSEMDELMWHYPKGRFLAHDKIPNEAVVNSPVHLSCQEPIAEEGLLINLSKDIPFFFGRFVVFCISFCLYLLNVTRFE